MILINQHSFQSMTAQFSYDVRKFLRRKPLLTGISQFTTRLYYCFTQSPSSTLSLVCTYSCGIRVSGFITYFILTWTEFQQRIGKGDLYISICNLGIKKKNPGFLKSLCENAFVHKKVHVCQQRSLLQLVCKNQNIVIPSEFNYRYFCLVSFELLINFSLFSKFKTLKKTFFCSRCNNNKCLDGWIAEDKAGMLSFLTQQIWNIIFLVFNKHTK